LFITIFFAFSINVIAKEPLMAVFIRNYQLWLRDVNDAPSIFPTSRQN